MKLNVNAFDDDTAMLVIRQGNILYTIGTDIDFSDDMNAQISFHRMDKLLERAKYNAQVQILEKNPEEVNTLYNESDKITKSQTKKTL